MPRKWIGAAAWSAKEAKVGDRLPYARLIDENTVLLRDGSVMSAIQVPGLLFETEDSDALNAHAATREVMLRSTLLTAGFPVATLRDSLATSSCPS